ncbi:leucine-rich repeat-containing protein 15-like [Linepithema humile]|uniref:leucine-rich repeat-containing protein 15-like n=1 Tax=Linepithema humile TaxID=83485 RepID=UPI00351E99D4
MISKIIIRFAFTIGVFVSWTLHSVANDDIFPKIPDYDDLCKDGVISLNFSNTKISEIGSDFVSSPLIVCLNFTNNHVERIAPNAFRKLSSLTNLFLSNNELGNPDQLFSFGGHKKLKVLILNNATHSTYSIPTMISGEYPNLEILIARNNSLFDLKKKLLFQFYFVPAFSDNPFPKLKILDLSENKLKYTTFVNFLPNSLQYLNLRNNNIPSLQLKEKGENLLALNIDNNVLYDVGYSYLTLKRLKNLSYLSLSGNIIKTVTSDAFRDTNKLSYLNLSANNIDSLYPDTFANLQFLNTLDLSNNNLKNIPQISNVINITVLYLSCNEIERIFSHAFIQTPKLTKLLLGGNQINQIDAEAFTYLSVLEELDLSGNKLSSLPKNWTESIVSLKYLDLSNNTFISLESLSLTSTLPLIELYIAMNSLGRLNIRYFENLPQTLTVNLEQKSNFSQLCRHR